MNQSSEFWILDSEFCILYSFLVTCHCLFMRLLDWLVVVAYLTYVVVDGVRVRRRARGTSGYFLANRNLPWWAVGLSVMATQMSAITLVGTTGQGYASGMRFLQFYYGMPLAMVILCVTSVPFFYRAKVFTAYEYLERRFDARTRTLTSLCFLFSRALGTGVIIAAPSVVFSIVLGWSETATVFAVGLTATVYTIIGGVQAVTWTDVKQMILVFIGLSVCLIVIIHKLPSDVAFADALHLAGATGRLTTVDTKFDLKETYTLWSGLIGGLFLMLSYFGCDQSQVQRFLTAKSVGEGRTSLLMSAVVKIPMQFLILLIGVSTFLFYQFERPPLIFNKVELQRVEQNGRGVELKNLNDEYSRAAAQRQQTAIELMRAERSGDADDVAVAKQNYLAADAVMSDLRKRSGALIASAGGNANDVNYVFPSFVIRNMPVGVVGIIIAAILAAAMSSSAGELNALATTTVMDIYRRLIKPDADDAHYVRAGRIATFFWGMFACGVALYATRLGSLIEVVNRFGSFFYGSLLGVFVLAFLCKRATGRGAFFGLIFGVVSVWIASRYTDIAFLWFNLIGCVVVVIVGMIISLFDKSSLNNKELFIEK
jgi:SSS family transporter